MAEEKKPRLLQEVGNYWNTRAEGYSMDVREELTGEVGKSFLSLIEKRAPKEEYARVLDIGCGPGFFVTLLGREGYKVTGIDYTENMLLEARRNVKEFGVTDATLLQMDAQKLSFADSSFDLIVTRNVTWNLEYPLEAYSEWMRVLRPGGIIINADGNHYLHYADENYAANEQKSQHKHMEGIDVSVIDNIARELPLSREHRPAWDIEQLKLLGAKNVYVEKYNGEKFVDGNHREIEVIRNFVLIAEK